MPAGSGRTVTAGALRERIEFLTPTRTGDHGFATTTYATAFIVWAVARLAGGSIDNTQDRAQPKLAVDFDIRYRADITADMKVIWRGMTFEIASAPQPVPTVGLLTVPCLQDSVNLAIDHLTVSPSPLYLTTGGDTFTMTATAFDADGNILAGRLPTWSSSDPSKVTIDVATGAATGIAVGSCLITATCEGKTASVTAIVTLPLTLTLDFAPLVRRSDLADPLVLVTNTGRTGYQDAVPQHTGAGLLNVPTNSPARVTYPKSATSWGFCAIVDAPMSSSFTPSASFITSSVLVDGPYPNTGAYSILPSDGNQYNALLDNRFTALATPDNQDASDFKRSFGFALKAQSAGDVGKTVRVNLMNGADVPGGSGWKEGTTPRFKFVDVVLSLLWQSVALTFDSSAQQASAVNPVLCLSMPAGVIAGHIVAPYMSRAWQAESDDPDQYNWLRPLPFHEQLGVQSTDIYCNCWSEDSDAPTLLGGAVRAPTAIPAPDAGRYFSAPTLKQYTLGVGDGITTTALVRIEDGGSSPPAQTNTPTSAAWVHLYISPAAGHTLPLDTDLAAYLIASGAATVAEDTVQRPDNFSSPGTMDTGQAWVDGTSAVWAVIGNTLEIETSAGDDFIYVDTGKSDCTIDTMLFTVGSDGSVVFRLTDPNNRWRVLWEGSVLRIDKIAAGVVTTPASTTLTLAAGDRVGVILSGNSISVTHNGTIVSALVISDSFNATATKHGLGAFNNGPRWSHFKVTYQSANAHTYGPIALERDSTRHGLAFGSPLVAADGSQFFRCRIPINLANEGYLDFIPKIVNAGAGQLVFNAYRAAVTIEGARGMGLHSAWAPKRTITGRSFADSAFETIPNIAVIMTTPTLLWGIRQVQPFGFGDLANINGAGASSIVPSLWQSGPYGSADYVFHCDCDNNGDGTWSMEILVARGDPTVNPGSYMHWSIRINNMSLAQTAAAWTNFVDFDIWCAAQNGAPILLGIGLGVGSGITWLAYGDSFLGGTVVYSNTPGTAWPFDNGQGAGAGIGHMGVNADLDRVRESGWFQAIAASNMIDDAVANIKTRIEYQIARRWGARKDRRIAT